MNFGSSFLNPNVEYFSLYPVQQEIPLSGGDSALDHNACFIAKYQHFMTLPDLADAGQAQKAHLTVL